MLLFYELAHKAWPLFTSLMCRQAKCAPISYVIQVGNPFCLEQSPSLLKGPEIHGGKSHIWTKTGHINLGDPEQLLIFSLLVGMLVYEFCCDR